MGDLTRDEAAQVLNCSSGCECYPYHGSIPHAFGESLFVAIAERDRGERPAPLSNFVEDPEAPGLGTWFCPKCEAGLEDARHG